MATVIIPKELEKRLAAIAHTRHIPLDSLTTEALKNYVEEQEHFQHEKAEDEARWQRYLRTGESISLEKMSKKLQILAQQATTRIP